MKFLVFVILFLVGCTSNPKFYEVSCKGKANRTYYISQETLDKEGAYCKGQEVPIIHLERNKALIRFLDLHRRQQIRKKQFDYIREDKNGY